MIFSISELKFIDRVLSEYKSESFSSSFVVYVICSKITIFLLFRKIKFKLKEFLKNARKSNKTRN